MIIAIDGPAGSGKSTVAKICAKRLGFLYIDTGAMYRALTFKAVKHHFNFDEPDSITALLKKTTIDLINKENGSIEVFVDGEDVSREIRLPEVSKFVSETARIPEVRQIMLGLQRNLGKKSSCILDGRDIGTVVFPDADKKFFLDADFKERTNRRFKELKASVVNITTEDVAGDLKKRDTIDSTRECAPLKKADDAIYVDTTFMTIEEVVERLLKEIG